MTAITSFVEKGMAMTGLAVLVFMFVFGTYSQYRAADDSSFMRRAVHVFTRPPLRGAAKIETPPRQETAFTLPGGTLTTVRGGSRLEWTSEGAVLLRGTATFDVPTTVREQRVLTDYGDVRMGPGQYALGRSGDGKLVLISVAAGLARLRSDTSDAADSTVVQVGPGEFGYLSSWGVAGKESPHLAKEYAGFARERIVFRSAGKPGGVERWRKFSWIRVMPGSRLTWDAGNPAVVHLTGEMAMVLDPRDGAMLVQSDFGEVLLRTGSFAAKTVNDSEYTPALLVSTLGAPPRAISSMVRSRPTPTEQIVEALGMESGRYRLRPYGAADYPALIPDSLAPRTPFGAAKGVRR